MRLVVIAFLLLNTISSFSQEDTKELIISAIKEMYDKNYESSLEMLTQAKSQAEKNENAENLFLAINNIGLNYYSMLDYGEALDHYLDAYTIAIKNLEPYHEMIVLNNIAILYSKDNQLEKAEEYFTKAYDLSIKNDEPKKRGLYAINLGVVKNKLGQFDIAEKYLKESLDLIKDDENFTLEAKLELANNSYLKENYTKARKISNELIEQFKGVSFSDQRINVLLLFSKTYQKEGDLIKAEEYTRKALSENLNIENKIEVYNQLSSIYLEKKEYEKLIDTKDSLMLFHEEFHQIKNGRQYETNRVKFEIQNYQKELKDQQEKYAAQQKTFYTIIISAIIIIILFAWALRISQVTSKQRKKLHERSEKILGLEIEKERTENLLLEKQLKEKETQLLLEQEQLKNEIEAKNRKLSAKALFLTDRNQLVNSIIKDLESTDNIQSKALVNDHIRNLKGLLRTDNEWDSFVTHFEEVNQGFLNNLKQKHSNLNANDIRFISYIYMNLTLKEIASILNITPEACRKRKERISKKLELKESTQLYPYLSTV